MYVRTLRYTKKNVCSKVSTIKADMKSSAELTLGTLSACVQTSTSTSGIKHQVPLEPQIVFEETRDIFNEMLPLM